MEFIWKELEKGEVEIISVNDLNFKIFAKAFNLTLRELDRTSSKEHVENQQLVNKIKIMENSKNNIVWVTIFTDNQRRAHVKDKETIKFIVDKKNPNRILLIDGIICVQGESYAETGQSWTYGGKKTAYGQTECYSNNNGHGRNVTTKSVISSHTDIGPQELVLKWDSRVTPSFNILNPNSSDHAQYYNVQTQSAYIVWEINQG